MNAGLNNTIIKMIPNNKRELICIKRLLLIAMLPFLVPAVVSLKPETSFADSGHQEPLIQRELDKAMTYLSEHTNNKTAAGLCASLLLLGRKQEFKTGQMLAISLIGSSAISAGLKYAVNRRRPTPPNKRSNSSFPSGHATAVFAAAYVIADSYPRLSIPVYAAAGSVAYSRLYLRRHYPSDVIAGALIGILTSKLVIKYQDHITLPGKGLVGLLFEREGLAVYFTF
jgi:undecaprenyl-diphosphatase